MRDLGAIRASEVGCVAGAARVEGAACGHHGGAAATPAVVHAADPLAARPMAAVLSICV